MLRLVVFSVCSPFLCIIQTQWIPWVMYTDLFLFVSMFLLLSASTRYRHTSQFFSHYLAFIFFWELPSLNHRFEFKIFWIKIRRQWVSCKLSSQKFTAFLSTTMYLSKIENISFSNLENSLKFTKLKTLLCIQIWHECQILKYSCPFFSS